MATTKTTPKDTAVQAPVQTNSERFTNKIVSEFGTATGGELKITESQKDLIKGYFVEIDRALKKAEEERVRKNGNNSDHTYDNNLPVGWASVNMPDLALDLVHFAKMGLDMRLDNMLTPIPYKNNKRNSYDITLMEGYNGKRYIAEKYGTDKLVDIVVELVHETDSFKAFKKDSKRDIESYEFEITNPFNRGDIIGGFAYLIFEKPEKNKLIIMTVKDIEKRKPRYASAEFWGGVKKEKVDGRWQEVEIEGWKEEMYRKTLLREACSSKYIVVDPAKIDENYEYLKAREARYSEIASQEEIDDNANRVEIDIDTGVVEKAPEEVVYDIPGIDEDPFAQAEANLGGN